MDKLTTWIAGFSITSILFAILQFVWTLYGDSIKEWYKPHADRHVENLGNLFASDKPNEKTSDLGESPSEGPSPVDELGLNPPDFRDYTSDIIDGIRWTWQWSGSAAEPVVEYIASLKSRCARCDRLIEPRGRTEYRDEIEGQRLMYGTMRGGHRTSVPFKWHSDYTCDGGCTDRTFPKTITEHQDTIRREIERRARNPAEWQAAPDRIRVAREGR